MYITIWNVTKIGEKQRTMQTQYRVLSCTLCVCVCVCVCVWCHTSEFHKILPEKLITGDIKIFVQNKIFSRPTRLSEPYVTRTKQIFCHGLMQDQAIFCYFRHEIQLVLLSLKVVKFETKMNLNFSHFWGRTSAGGNKPWSKKRGQVSDGRGLTIFLPDGGTPQSPQEKILLAMLR